MKQKTYTEEQSGVVVTRGLKNYYTSVNFNVVAVEDYWEYDSVTMTTDIPFTKENFDVVKEVIDAVLADGDTIPVSAVGEVADLFNVGKTSNEVVESARKVLIDNIEKYNVSDNVNSFTIGGQVMWLTVEERQQIASQINAHEAVGRTEMTRWFNGLEYTFPLPQWKYMLAVLEVYCGDAINVTQQHKSNVEAITTYSELVAYDFTADYPSKPEF